MGRKSGSSVLKRQRELKKAEKAAQKRERKGEKESAGAPEVASVDDLAGYGLVNEDEEEEAESERSD